MTPEAREKLAKEIQRLIKRILIDGHAPSK
jgi:hypothetical protein